MTETTSKGPAVVIGYIYYAVSISFFLGIFYYYWTGIGGPTLLAMTLIPVVFVLFTLQALRQNELYPALPPVANYLIAFAYCAFSFYCAYYMNTEYMAIGLERVGAWNTTDLAMGGVMTLLIMEYARKRHMPLFILNIVLILYAVYGNWIPGMFYHAGLSWERLITANSVEVSTGIFSRLPQIALTTVGSFLLVLSLLRGFGCIKSLLRATKRVAFRSPHAIPQSAVVGSMCVGMVSGSGAANAITIGSATIPAMIASGIPPATAAAIELASSLGGQLMPPVMGIAAFLMAEFLGVVVIRAGRRGRNRGRAGLGRAVGQTLDRFGRAADPGVHRVLLGHGRRDERTVVGRDGRRDVSAIRRDPLRSATGAAPPTRDNGPGGVGVLELGIGGRGLRSLLALPGPRDVLGQEHGTEGEDHAEGERGDRARGSCRRTGSRRSGRRRRGRCRSTSRRARRSPAGVGPARRSPRRWRSSASAAHRPPRCRPR